MENIDEISTTRMDVDTHQDDQHVVESTSLQKNLFLQIPNCVQLRIFGHLDVRSIGQSIHVSHAWNSLLRHESLWRDKWIELFGEENLYCPSWRQAVTCSYGVYSNFSTDQECLMWAIKNRYESMAMHMAIENPSLVNSGANNLLEIPICIAVTMGSYSMVELFLKLGAPVTCRNDDLSTPLSLATQRGDIEMVKLLLLYGGNVDEELFLNKRKIIHVAAYYGYVDLLKYLVSLGANINEFDRNGITPIYLAALGGCTATLQLLIDLGAEMEMVMSPLYGAAEGNKLECLNLLISRGAVINCHKGCGALYVAAAKGHLLCAETLLDAGALLETSRCDYSPLYAACRKNQAGVVDALLKRGASVNHIFERRHTCMFSAAEEGHAEIVRKLLEHGANVETTAYFERTTTSLKMAVRKGHLEVCQVLLDYNANISCISGGRDIKILYKMCSKNFLPIVTLLISRGASPEIINREFCPPSERAFHQAENAMCKSIEALYKKSVARGLCDSKRKRSWFERK